MTAKDALQMLNDYIDDTINHACYHEHKHNCSHTRIKEALKII